MKKKAEVDVAVLLLFFNRAYCLKQVFEQVKKARPSKLFLYQDGPRNEKDMEGINECRKVVSEIDWECEVHTFYQDKNYGCDPSEYISQKWMFDHVEKGIVLEDDDVPSVSFFKFCKELLDKYENDERICMISGMNYEEKTIACPYDYFFTSDSAIWGWASWKRVIDKWDGKYSFLDDNYHMLLLDKYIKKTKQRQSLIHGFYQHRKSGKEHYESILIANQLLNHGLAIVPTKNLMTNIGLTSDSTHFNGSQKSVPKSISRIFTMKRFDLDFPLKHPNFVIENLYYKERIDKILARNSRIRIFVRQIQTLLLRLFYGDFSSIKKSILKRF